ncbi:hypothetical protein GDO81_015788 [Engystomops pustulosus]|uniref:Uncharacterized protein n=1 Tax=Engystomops pustulosus TaxID=76066 RepID=A0AAV7ATZ0_ENGPU|nr:hypothetical protein GDO81_015788 [Engystomops pustulosus]
MLLNPQQSLQPTLTSWIFLPAVTSFSYSQDAGGEQNQQEAKQREEEMRNSILSQVLSQAARARLNNLRIVKPEKAKAVEITLYKWQDLGS